MFEYSCMAVARDGEQLAAMARGARGIAVVRETGIF
jgi:hypothetical protein